MLRRVPWLMCSLVLLAGCARDQSAEVASLKQQVSDLTALAGPPPDSLDAYYPPSAPAPVFLAKMTEQAGAFSGMVLRLNEGNRREAKVLFDRFKAQYTANAGLVPEWQQAFPMKPVEELGALVEQAEPAKVMEAVGKVGAVCHACHVLNMPRTQQRYHWSEFSALSLPDPESKTDLEFSQFMMSLELSMTGMQLELQGGQAERARGHLGMFRTKLGVLKEICQACHETERKYFVDAEVFALVDKLDAALRVSPPDGKLAGDLGQRIGTESCGRCHLVHIPAAYAHARWRQAAPPAK